jgi:hypothetical protein
MCSISASLCPPITWMRIRLFTSALVLGLNVEDRACRPPLSGRLSVDDGRRPAVQRADGSGPGHGGGIRERSLGIRVGHLGLFPGAAGLVACGEKGILARARQSIAFGGHSSGRRVVPAHHAAILCELIRGQALTLRGKGPAGGMEVTRHLGGR